MTTPFWIAMKNPRRLAVFRCSSTTPPNRLPISSWALRDLMTAIPLKMLVADSDTPASVSWYLCPVTLSGRATSALPKKETPAIATRPIAIGQLQINSQVMDMTMRYICFVPFTKALMPSLAVSTSFCSLDITSPDSWVSKYSALPPITAWKSLLLRLSALSSTTFDSI